MAGDESSKAQVPEVGPGQIVLKPGAPLPAPREQLRSLYQLSDPALSELGLDELLRELLRRVRDALKVDTVAILLLDAAGNELVARAAKGIEEEVERGVRIPIGQGFAGRIASERVAIFIGDVDHADILNPILREKGIRSLLGVPLIVDGQLIGVMHVGSLVPREFDQRDLIVLELAAARAAPGIERARLYSELEREHEVAVVLQRSLLPGRLPQAVGVSTAARYVPARGEVGGDWYDVIEIPRGLLGMAIGDVFGHGLRAAAMMGRVRTALHSYALEGHGPGRTLELVDRFMRSLGQDSMATAAYAVLDPQTGRLALATAGHPPPILIAAAASGPVEITPAPPLGAFPNTSYSDRELSVSAGEILLFYTDGLIERREAPHASGMDELVELVGSATSADDACLRVMETLVPPEGLDDDVAVVALQTVTVPA